MKQKDILVTGGCGFIGSAFIDAVNNYNSNINFSRAKSLTVVNVDSMTYASNPEVNKNKEDWYNFINMDIGSPDFDKILDIYRPEVIVHFAAESHVDRSIENPNLFLETNILGTSNILNAIAKKPDYNPYFVLMSTDEVWGDASEVGNFHALLPYKPSSAYAVSKAASDMLFLSHVRTHGLRGTIVHSCNNFGPGQHPEKFIPQVIIRTLSDLPINVYGNGLQEREWRYVNTTGSDILYHILGSIMKSAIGRYSVPHDGVNLYTINENLSRLHLFGGLWNNLEIIKLIQDNIKTRMQFSPNHTFPPVNFVKDRLGHDKSYKSCFVYSPINIEIHIRETIDYYNLLYRAYSNVLDKDFRIPYTGI